jgi:hypothetical protein
MMRLGAQRRWMTGTSPADEAGNRNFNITFEFVTVQKTGLLWDHQRRPVGTLPLSDSAHASTQSGEVDSISLQVSDPGP